MSSDNAGWKIYSSGCVKIDCTQKEDGKWEVVIKMPDVKKSVVNRVTLQCSEWLLDQYDL